MIEVDASYYSKDYFERGIETGKSNYSCYRWIPELTIPMTMAMIDFLHIEKPQLILDYGCAKGYLVKAFRTLNRLAFGVDISAYALSNLHPDVINYCYHVELMSTNCFDFCIAKDVFEHISPDRLLNILEKINAEKLFTIIPLGKDGKYNASVNNLDKSHVICEPSEWWIKFFKNTKWKLESFSNTVEGIKESYKDIPEAHGFFVLKRR